VYRIKLLKTHTHAGQVHFAGSVLEVDEMTASWLILRGVGQAAEETIDIAANDIATPKKSRTNRKVKE
jgi:hypothetical protein